MLPNLERLRRNMREHNVDAIIATSPENVTYLSEYHCTSQWHNKGTQVYAVVPVDDGVAPFLVLPSLEIDAWAESPSWITDLRPYGFFYRDYGAMNGLEHEDDQIIVRLSQNAAIQSTALEILAQTLQEKGLATARLAVDETGMAPSLWRMMLEKLGGAKISDGSALLRQSRMVKTPEEIHRLTRAAEINDEALRITMAAAVPGITERELINLFMAEVSKQGGIPAFWTTNAGRRTGHIHTLVSDSVIQAGDLVKWDVGCTYELYWADTSRTIALTTATDEQIRTYDALLAGEQAAINKIRAGVAAADVFEEAIETIRAAGLPRYQRSHCGHGIGIAVYDPPLIQPSESSTELAMLGRTDMLLEAGMVLCIETPYYIPGRWGMTVEDTVLVEETGAKVLTSNDRNLIRA